MNATLAQVTVPAAEVVVPLRSPTTARPHRHRFLHYQEVRIPAFSCFSLRSGREW
jgi:hypothetical protein